MNIKSFLLSVLVLLGLINGSYSLAAAPKCEPGSFCRYTGKVERCYVNEDGLILLYFDTPASVSDAGAAGYSITKTAAAAYNYESNENFGDYFYTTCLTALVSDETVTLFMDDTFSNYLKADRIWIVK